MFNPVQHQDGNNIRFTLIWFGRLRGGARTSVTDQLVKAYQKGSINHQEAPLGVQDSDTDPHLLPLTQLQFLK